MSDAIAAALGEPAASAPAVEQYASDDGAKKPKGQHKNPPARRILPELLRHCTYQSHADYPQRDNRRSHEDHDEHHTKSRHAERQSR
jgi:hypothetical protein